MSGIPVAGQPLPRTVRWELPPSTRPVRNRSLTSKGMNRMAFTGPRPRGSLRARAAVPSSGARTAVAALVSALVVGILGMHALASDGTAATPAASSSMTGMSSAHEAAMASGDSHDEHAHAANAQPPLAAAGTGADSNPGSGHDMANMVMLCVVMLAAAALTLLVLLAVRFVRTVLPAAFQPAAMRAHALAWVRGTGPPYVWQFSVIRC